MKTWSVLSGRAIPMVNVLLLLSFVFLLSCSSEQYKVKTATDKNGYKYEYVTNDPAAARTYILENGLKVILSQNPDEPRVATLIGVRAGSTYDPAETTGLAHYFEHMMFKGTSKIATLDWEKEKAIILQISDLFEERRKTDDPEMKNAIFRKIDSLSGVAATYAAPNEYDKLISGLGAKRTNAGTSYESTVYINDIPINELEKWLMIESERFSDIVLRLFHTELETVYEEFNMYQDDDMSRASNVLMASLFPTHPYGRDVIGLPEHLKNPSMVNILNFAKQWYVPNNMAIVLSGDIDFEKTIQLVDKYFGKMKSNPEVKKMSFPEEKPIEKTIVKEVTGPKAEALMLAYRFKGDNSEDQKYVTLIDMILSNSKAGLIDLDLNQQQKVLNASSSAYFLRDYGIHEFYVTPRQGQTLDEAKNLILGEIEKIKKGEYDEWLLEAVINDMRLQRIRQYENNFGRAYTLMNIFINDVPYTEKLKFLDDIEKITKEQLVKYANEHYKDNYVVLYKKTGANDALVKVEKPQITPVNINREGQSEFYKNLTAIDAGKIEPKFVDFKSEISEGKLQNDVPVYYIKNKTNELFNLSYILDMGKNNDLKLPHAVGLLPYLGTTKYSPADLQKELYRYGLSLNVNAQDNRCYVTISGLQKSFEKGVEILEHILAEVKPDEQAYKDYVQGILKKRADSKLDDQTILWSAMMNYGKYGATNPFTNILSEEQMTTMKPEELTNIIKGMMKYKHKVFYYGQEELGKITPVIDKYHKTAAPLADYPPKIKFPELEATGNSVYYVNYDMVQSNIILLTKGPAFDKTLIPPARLFNEYFGSGLSSIVFQELREARGLAYSAFSAFATPSRMDESFYNYAYIGTQADKLISATDGMIGLMNNMVRADKQFDMAKESVLKQIDSERIIKANIFWTYMGNLDKGIDYDIRKDVYDYIGKASMDDFAQFFDANIKGKNYTFLVVGNKQALDMNVLKKLGTVKELTLEEIFNY